MRISDWSSDVCSSDLEQLVIPSAARDLHATSPQPADAPLRLVQQGSKEHAMTHRSRLAGFIIDCETGDLDAAASFWSGALGMPVAERYAEGEAEYAELSNTPADLQSEVQKARNRKSTRLNSSH